MSGRIAVVEGALAEQAVDALLIPGPAPADPDADAQGAHEEGEEEGQRLLAERGGAAFRAERARLGAVPGGEAAITAGGDLPARRVIHLGLGAPGVRPDPQTLRAALRRGLDLAAEHGCRTLALPPLGTGVRGLPLREVAELLLAEAEGRLREAGPSGPFDEICFVLAGEQAYRTFESVWDVRKIAAQMERLRASRDRRSP